MNETTVLALKLIGPVMFLAGLGLVVNMKYFLGAIKDLDEESPVFILMMGAVSLVIGLLIIAKHNLWGNVHEIIVSIIGCLAILKGVLLLLVPRWLLRFSESFLSTTVMTVAGVVYVLLGGYLSWVVYFV